MYVENAHVLQLTKQMKHEQVVGTSVSYFLKVVKEFSSSDLLLDGFFLKCHILPQYVFSYNLMLLFR